MDVLDKSKIVNEIAALAAKHKIIPFLGAGSSIAHLALDWDVLSDEMASVLGISNKSNLEVAERYENKKGKTEFCNFLKKKLLVNEYFEDKDIVPLIVISMGLGLVYTTNQDNVFELCVAKYGRRFKRIVTLGDLGDSLPGELLYIKYHGDLDVPESLIFTQSSYEKRIEEVDHFLNVRMRSDLLAKSFLFVGYSFRDPNIIKLFEELNAAFRGQLPTSYLIAYEYTPELEELNLKYGVEIIDPVKELENKYSIDKSFHLLLSEICKKTYLQKSADDIENLFNPTIPPTSKVVSKFEVLCIKDKVSNSPIDEALPFFRATFDNALIPEILHEEIVDTFVQLAKQCKERHLSDQLSGAAFNLILAPIHEVKILAAVKATAQFRGQGGGTMDLFLPIAKSADDSLRPVSTACAIEMLQEWNVKISDSFRKHVTNWIEGYHELPAEIVGYIRKQVDFAWSERTTLEHPFRYWERLGHKSPFGKAKTFKEIRGELLDRWPKQFTKPYEE